MKKNKGLLAVTAIAITGAIMPQEAGAHNNYDYVENGGVAFTCDFQDQNTVAEKVTGYNFTSLTPSSTMQGIGFSQQVPWVFDLRDSYQSTNYFTGATSQFTTSGQADAWLVTTAIDVPTTGYQLSWKSEALFLDKRDGLKVFISTKGGTPKDDFADEPVWQIDEEEAGATEDLDGEWVDHSISLDQYAGKTIWVAFVNQSTDKGVICLDDITVMRPVTYSMASSIDNISTTGSAKVGAKVTAMGEAISSCTISYATAGGKQVSQTFSGLTLEAGQSQTLVMDEDLTLTGKGQFDVIDVWAEVNGVRIGQKDSVLYASFVPDHKVLLEEYTFSTCGYCPLGILSIENLEKIYGDKVLPVAVHYGDQLNCEDYYVGLALSEAPTGRVDRGSKVSPMPIVDGKYSFSGSTSFLNATEEAMDRLVLAQPTITKAVLNGDKIEVEVSTKFAKECEAGHLRMAIAVSENDLETKYTQLNNLSYIEQAELGRFGKGGEMGQSYIRNFTYQDVARGIFPSFNGEKNVLPATVEADKEYTNSFTISLSDIAYGKLENLKITAILVNGNTAGVVNSDRKSLSLDPTGITSAENNATQGQPAYYDLQGRRLSAPAKGINIKVWPNGKSQKVVMD